MSIPVNEQRNAVTSNVASSASNVTLLSASKRRIGACVVNDSTQVLYLKLGATAAATSFTKALATNEYYEIPFGYNGQVDGIWASANGNARITEVF